MNINGLNINYEIRGDGKPLILLHGWGGSLESLKKLSYKLSAISYQLILVDLPGFGKSDKPDRAYGLDDYAGIIEGIVRELNLGKISLFGHSFGGAVAVKVVVRGNVEVEKLILCNASGIRKQIANSCELIALAKGLKRVPIFGALFIKLRKLYYYYILKNRDYIDHPQLRETYKKIVAEDITPLLRNVMVPTLLIWGEKDKDTPLEFGKIMNREIPDSKLEVVKAETHGLPLQKPELVSDLIEKF